MEGYAFAYPFLIASCTIVFEYLHRKFRHMKAHFGMYVLKRTTVCTQKGKL